MRVQTRPQTAYPQHKIPRQPLIRRVSDKAPVDKSAQWLNRAVVSGFVAVGLYLTAHFSYALVDNVIRIANLSSQQTQWKRLKVEKATEYQQLTKALHQAQSPTGLEALVRNKLQWVEDQEALVRLH